MSKLKIDMDSYKKFFHSENGLVLMTQIIESGDYSTTKAIAKWEKCPSNVLDKIVAEYTVVCEDSSMIVDSLNMLEQVADNPKISVKTLERILEFVLGFLDDYSNACDVLEEIAESKKLTANIAERLYKVAVDNNLDDVVEELGENKNTPDEILFNIIDTFVGDLDIYKAASEEIIRRYRKIKEKSSEE